MLFNSLPASSEFLCALGDSAWQHFPPMRFLVQHPVLNATKALSSLKLSFHLAVTSWVVSPSLMLGTLSFISISSGLVIPIWASWLDRMCEPVASSCFYKMICFGYTSLFTCTHLQCGTPCAGLCWQHLLVAVWNCPCSSTLTDHNHWLFNPASLPPLFSSSSVLSRRCPSRMVLLPHELKFL